MDAPPRCPPWLTRRELGHRRAGARWRAGRWCVDGWPRHVRRCATSWRWKRRCGTFSKKNLQNVGQHFCCKMLATLFSIEILIQLSKKMLVNIFVFKMLKIFVIMEALGKKRRKV
jgi:hypothetical protein